MDDFANDPTTTGSLPVGGSATGALETEFDRDWFAIEFEAGVIYDITLETGINDGTGGTLGAGVFYVYQADGTEIGSGYAEFGTSRISADVTGTHYVEVDLDPFINAQGPRTGTYTLSAEDVGSHVPASVETQQVFTFGEPVVIDNANPNESSGWVRAELEAGGVYRLDGVPNNAFSGFLYFDLLDAQGDRVADLGDFFGSSSDVTFSVAESGTYFVSYESFEGAIYQEASLILDQVDAPAGDAPGALADAVPIEAGATITGDFEFQNDLDLYAVTFEAGRGYQVKITPSDQRSYFDADPYLVLYDAEGTEIFFDDTIYYIDPPELRSDAITADQTATYYVGVGIGDYLYFFNDDDYHYALDILSADPLDLEGTGNADSLEGGVANDRLSGLAGDDTLKGGDGDDTLLGGGGRDEIAAQRGDDSVEGGSGNDNVGGGPGNDTLRGGAGEDQLAGGEGDDLLDGGDRDDLLWGGAGADTILGGAGHDHVGASWGADSVSGGDGDDLIGAGGSDDSVDAGAGNDTVWAGGSNDVVMGGDGNDYLKGGWGDDMLSGGAGDDTLEANTGADMLTGGGGADVFLFELRSDYFREQSVAITDFNSGVDRIVVDLRGTAVAEDVVVNADEGVLYLNLNDSVLEIGLGSGTTVSAADFEFI